MLYSYDMVLELWHCICCLSQHWKFSIAVQKSEPPDGDLEGRLGDASTCRLFTIQRKGSSVYLFIHLLAVLGLCCSGQASSSCQKWRLLYSWGVRASHFSGFSSCSTGLAVLQHVESSWTRNQTHVPCIGRWILISCTTREVPLSFLFFF